MIIVYLHQYFKTPAQAGGTRSYEMAKRLVSWGHQVHMVTSWTSETTKDDWFIENIDGIHVHWLPVNYNNKMGFTERLIAFFHFAFRAASRAASLHGDVIFASSTPLTIAVPGIYSARKVNCPLVFEVRDLWPQIPIAMGVLKNPIIKWLAKLLEKVAYQQSTSIVALSADMADGVALTGVPSSRITVIPNSADLELFDPNLIAHGVFRRQHPELILDPFILYPGTLGRVNGVSYIANLAFEVLRLGSKLKFVIIGDGIEKDNLIDIALRNKTLNVNLFIYPSMPKKELTFAFKDSSMIISTIIDLPALEANSANKLFDAMAAGKPIAINHGGWQRNLIEKNNLGLVLPRDILSASRILLDFFDDPDRLFTCGINSRKIGSNEFSRDLLAKRLESVLLSSISIK